MSEAEGKRLVAEANKKKEGGVFKFFGNNSSRLEEAAELFIQAANKFKGGKNCIGKKKQKTQAPHVDVCVASRS